MNNDDTKGVVFAKTTTYAGALLSIVSGMTLTEIGVIVGIVVGVAGFIAAQYWQYKRYVLDKRVAMAKIQALKENCDIPSAAH